MGVCATRSVVFPDAVVSCDATFYALTSVSNEFELVVSE